MAIFKKVKRLWPELSLRISVLRKMLSEAVKQVCEDRAVINARPSLPQTRTCHLRIDGGPYCPHVCSRQVSETTMMGFHARSAEGILAALQALLTARRKPKSGRETEVKVLLLPVWVFFRAES